MSAFNYFLPSLAFAVAGLTTAAIVLVAFTNLYLTTSGPFSSDTHTLYILALSIISTLLSAFIASQARLLFLRQIDRRLYNATSSDRQVLVSSPDFGNIDRRWKVILAVSTLLEKFRHPRIAIVYLLTGLTTSAIIAAFSPSVTLRPYPFTPILPLGGDSDRCVPGELPSKPMHVAYWWSIPNSMLGAESGFFIWASLDDCPTRQAISLTGSINIENPSVFAYDDKGVAVHPSAIGTPLTIYYSEGDWSNDPNVGVQGLITRYGPNIYNTTQCVPVMIKNPISCHTGGQIIVDSDSSATAVADDGTCNSTHSFAFNPNDPFGADGTTTGIMSDGMCTHGAVGQGTIVISALWHYAQYLALTVGDSEFIPGDTVEDGQYTVTCSVDTTDVFDYRLVTLSLQDSEVITESGYAKSLVAGDSPCTPAFNSAGLVQIATAAAANWEPLKQSQNLDGLFEAILQQSVINITALTPRQPPWAFPNSNNALEDVLGLIAGLVVSRINTTVSSFSGTSLVTATRVGSGSWYAVLLAIPPGLLTIILAFLVFRNSRVFQVNSGSLVSLVRFGQNLYQPLATPDFEEEGRHRA